jgi:Tfp pilus assembly protein PilV
MRAFLHHIHHRLRPLRRNQDGAVLLEVVFSTLVVAIVTTAVLKGVEGSVKTTVENRERSVAAQLAEQDQERMRSYKATSLDGYSQSRTVTVRGLNYTVASSTQWIYDSSGTKSCTSDTSQASYLKLMTTVTPVKEGPPVSATSLLTPPNGTFSTDKGSLAVMITDRNGAARPNIPVAINGNGVSDSDTTNSSGCANFYYIPTGNYTVTPSAPGLVDRTGDASPTITAGVVGGQSTLTTIELDVPATVNITFDTKVGTNAAVGASSQYARIESSGLASPGFLPATFSGTYSNATPPNTFTFSSLYPFTSGYAAFGGNCDKNDPTNWNGTYTANATAVSPGGTHSIVARLPAINIQVKRGTTSTGATTYTSATVKVTPTDSGCTATFPTQTSNGTGPSSSVAALPKPGYPWGNYNVCASDGTKKATVAIANTNANGTDSNTGTTTIDPTVIWINTSSGGTSGTC